MTKAKVLERFHGTKFSVVYEIGQTYDFEEARAESLAARGLIEILKDEKVEQPTETLSAEVESVSEPATEVSETVEVEKPKRGRPSAKNI